MFTQNVPDDIPWEVIVVDNASTDNTEAAQKIWDKYNCLASFKVVKEQEPGLSAARLKGFNTAKYEYVVLCDDDNRLQKDFVKNAYDIMRSNDEIGVLGGQSKAEFDKIEPNGLKTGKTAMR
ncbi:MAG: glycosyltransferase family 2 protein [Ignavibacteria bacterium]|nr:glycosyltransferase family 2 protein [Ignavibacteria bacterium]